MSRQRRREVRREEEAEDDEYEDGLLPSATLTDPRFQIPEYAQGREITRKFVLQFDNSLSGLAARPNNAVWRPADGRYDCFQSTTRYAPNCQRSKTRRGNLEQVIMLGMKIKKVDSTFPCQLGLKIHGCKGNYYLSSGEQYSYLISPAEKNHCMNEVVLVTNPYVNSEYLSRFPGMTAQSLRSEGIMNVPHEDYKFVDKNHPLIEMIGENAEVLHVDLSDAQLVDNRWYKIDNQITERCLTDLETELVANLPGINLLKFNGSIERPYGLNFDDKREVADNIPKGNSQMLSRVMSQEFRATVVLEMTYIFM